MTQVSKKQQITIGLVAIAALMIFVYGLVGMIGTYKLSNGCFLRYSSMNSLNSRTAVSVEQFGLRADGNYDFAKIVNSTDANGNVISKTAFAPNPNSYGQWYMVGTEIMPEQNVSITLDGDISLCRAYVPDYNLQQNSGKDKNNNLIPVPRLEEATAPIPLIIDATAGEWRNALELYQLDRFQLFIGNNQTPNSANGATSDVTKITLVNTLNSQIITADCSSGKTSYNPICGRYTPYSGQNYVSGCDKTMCSDTSGEGCNLYNKSDHNYPAHQNTKICNRGGLDKRDSNKYDYCDALYCKTGGGQTTSTIAGYNVINNINPYSTDFTTLMSFDQKFGNTLNCVYATCESRKDNWPSPLNSSYCANTKSKCGNNMGCQFMPADPTYNLNCKSTKNPMYDNNNSTYATYINDNKIWFTADDAAGLVFRFNNNINPSNKNVLGTPGDGYQAGTFGFVSKPDNLFGSNNIYRHIYDGQTAAALSYLQLRVINSKYVPANKATGGYVLYIKQTKCRREKGGALTDSGYKDRGRVSYLIIGDSTLNPNTNSNLTSDATDITFDTDGTYNLPAKQRGFLWLKINNKKEDYPNSFGAYNTTITFKTPIAAGGFTFFTDLFNMFQTKLVDLSRSFLQNLLCYNGKGITHDVSKCVNLFNYLKALMSLYIMVTAMMFMVGMVEIKQKEIVIIVAKIAIISGLISGSTYELINNFFIPIATNFVNVIIANFDGLGMFAKTSVINGTKVVNPLTFMDELLTRVILDPTFSAQIVALLSFGSHGFIYFIIMIVTLCIMLVAVFRAAATYIMALVALCVLINIAPFFLSFMLFNYTKSLFDKWLKFTIRYMIEPVILIVGIIVLVNLFTVYLDYTINYSVCWKCGIAFTIPFSAIPGLAELAATKVPLYCINWFVPWGHDSAGAGANIVSSPNFANIIALLIIANGLRTYIDVADGIMNSLCGAESGGPSAIKTGGAMVSAVGQKMLKQVGLDKNSRKQMQNRLAQRSLANKAAINSAKYKSLVKKDNNIKNISDKIFGKERARTTDVSGNKAQPNIQNDHQSSQSTGNTRPQAQQSQGSNNSNNRQQGSHEQSQGGNTNNDQSSQSTGNTGPQAQQSQSGNNSNNRQQGSHEQSQGGNTNNDQSSQSTSNTGPQAQQSQSGNNSNNRQQGSHEQSQGGNTRAVPSAPSEDQNSKN